MTVSDLHATIYRTLGISPKYGIEVEQRPFYVTKDGLGQPVMDVLALNAVKAGPAFARTCLIARRISVIFC